MSRQISQPLLASEGGEYQYGGYGEEAYDEVDYDAYIDYDGGEGSTGNNGSSSTSKSKDKSKKKSTKRKSKKDPKPPPGRSRSGYN